jgi:biofilm PGA synthesis N-glycosyltransferase PgaC
MSKQSTSFHRLHALDQRHTTTVATAGGGRTPAYVLITPARNEARYIEQTLQSMVAQTVRPLKWIIVNDGSTDETASIVARYTAEHPWIELVSMPARRERHFAGKVHAFNAGRARVEHLPYEVIGNLDADVSFEEDHFAFLVSKFNDNPKFGVVGAPFREGSMQYDYRFTNIENVWGGCQLFRRACFDDIGGYTPVRTGCIDHIAVVAARMKGWSTRTFTERVCIHHRVMGTAVQGGLQAKFKHGAKDYSVGNHPLWQLSRAVYQMSKKPFILGGMALAAGYAWSFVQGKAVSVSPEMVEFTRSEQMRRIRQLFERRRMARSEA